MHDIEQPIYNLIIDCFGITVEGLPFNYTMFFIPNEELPVLIEGMYLAKDSLDAALNMIPSYFTVTDKGQIERGNDAIFPCVIAEGNIIMQTRRN